MDIKIGTRFKAVLKNPKHTYEIVAQTHPSSTNGSDPNWNGEFDFWVIKNLSFPEYNIGRGNWEDKIQTKARFAREEYIEVPFEEEVFKEYK